MLKASRPSSTKKPDTLLGDYVALAIEKIVPKVLLDQLGEDCGCKERQAQLNYFHNNMRIVSTKMQLAINDAYYQLFNERVKRSGCGQCVRRRIDRIKLRLKELEKQNDIIL
jgi:hypothetical protein